MITSRLSSKGQLTLPKRIRDTLGARPGSLIAYDIRGKVVTLKHLDPLDAAYHAALSRTLGEWNARGRGGIPCSVNSGTW